MNIAQPLLLIKYYQRKRGTEPGQANQIFPNNSTRTAGAIRLRTEVTAIRTTRQPCKGGIPRGRITATDAAVAKRKDSPSQTLQRFETFGGLFRLRNGACSFESGKFLIIRVLSARNVADFAYLHDPHREQMRFGVCRSSVPVTPRFLQYVSVSGNSMSGVSHPKVTACK